MKPIGAGALQKPSNVVLQLDPGPGNGRNSEGSFVTLRDGTIFFAYTRYVTNGNGDHEPSVIASRVSRDGGFTWTNEDRILVTPDDAMNVMSVSLLRLQSGRILFMYLRKVQVGDGISCVPWIGISDDEMRTFSQPVQAIRSNGYHCVNNDRIVQLSSGRLVIPVSQHRLDSKGFRNPGLIFYLFSDDEGQSWQESKSSYYRCFPDGHGLQEPGLIELKDGRLWSWSRTGWPGLHSRCGHQWQSFSEDQGVNWTEPEPSQFVSPYSPLSMKRVPGTRDLLAVWNNHSGRFPTPTYETPFWECEGWERHRTPLSLAISSDEGITWRHHTLLEDAPDHGFCYTAIHFTEDAVLLAYCAGGVSTGTVLDRLRMRRIPLSELYRDRS